MNVQAVHVVVHTPEQAREIIRESRAIADELGQVPSEWEQVFREACRLLGARVSMMMQPQQVPIDLAALKGVGGRH